MTWFLVHKKHMIICGIGRVSLWNSRIIMERKRMTLKGTMLAMKNVMDLVISQSSQ
jgi:hypothetical protein